MWSSTSVASKTLPRAKRHGSPWRGRVGLILLFALFFAPALLAWLLVLSGWRPASLTHHGELIQPPRPVAELVLGGAAGTDLFAGLWSLLLVVPSECGDDCRQALDGLQRVRIALNKDAGRVQLLLALPNGVAAPAPMPAGVALLRLPAAQASSLASGNGAALAVHIVDPFEYRMMRYAAPFDASGLLKDLRRLLRLSNEEIERLRRREVGHG
ncbi:MAG: hypothetical protein GX093_11315 [Xanthomonadaceae bacterium]|nr:hypothetical protein [Xanthomonadaceae bacterium]